MLTALRFAMMVAGALGAITAGELLGRGRGPESVVCVAGALVLMGAALFLRERR